MRLNFLISSRWTLQSAQTGGLLILFYLFIFWLKQHEICLPQLFLFLIFIWLSSLVVAHGLSCLAPCGILVPRPGMEPESPALEGRFLTTGPPGKSPAWLFFIVCHSLNTRNAEIIWILEGLYLSKSRFMSASTQHLGMLTLPDNSIAFSVPEMIWEQVEMQRGLIILLFSFSARMQSNPKHKSLQTPPSINTHFGGPWTWPSVALVLLRFWKYYCHPKRDQAWVFTGRTDVEAETPIL